MNGNKVKYPGIRTTADGAGAIVWVETHVTQGACAYPITSSTTMGAGYQVEVASGKKNLWDEPLYFIELESEHSSASTCEGFALAGGRVTNFTSGQGLILMKEVLYTISGKRLPVVFHIGARALTSHSLNVHAGHDDVIGVADCGWGMLFARNAQEAGDLALISHRASEDGYTPFLNIQDGFLTTHTIETVLLIEPEMMHEYLQPPSELLNLMDPYNPVMSGVVQNQDSYMKGKIAQRYYYDKLPNILENAMKEFTNLTGRKYGLIDSYMMDDAEYALIGMGSMMETAIAAAKWMRQEKGWKVGVLHITSYRPFPGAMITDALSRIKSATVFERLDIPLMQSNPLAGEIKASIADSLNSAPGYLSLKSSPKIYSCSAGLGSRDVRAGDFIAAVEAMMKGLEKRYFTVGIKHPDALPRETDPDVRPEGSFSMRGHSVGGYGSVTTNKIIASIVSDIFEMDVQAYPKYGSEKKGLPTTYYLTIAKEHILPHTELEHVEFVALNDVNAFNLANPLIGLYKDGMVFIQTFKTKPEEIWLEIPRWARDVIKEKGIRILALDTVKIAKEVSSSPDLVQRMQGIVLLGIFLKMVPFVKGSNITEDTLFKGVEKSLRKYFGRRGERVVQDNLNAVKRGYHEVFKISSDIVYKKASA